MTIRGGRARDARALGRLVVGAFAESPSAIYEPDELGDPKLLGMDILEDARDDPRQILLLGEVDGALAALARAVPRRFVRTSHIIMVALVVWPSWRGRGVGRALLSETVRRAFLVPGAERLELRAASDDVALRGLAESLGWRAERREREALVRDGAAKDVLIYMLDQSHWVR